MKQAVMIAPGKIEETSHSLTMIELTPGDLREIESAAQRGKLREITAEGRGSPPFSVEHLERMTGRCAAKSRTLRLRSGSSAPRVQDSYAHFIVSETCGPLRVGKVNP